MKILLLWIVYSFNETSESKMLQLLHIKDYQMQTLWLPMLDKLIADDLSWKKVLYGYSSRLLRFLINVRSNTLPSPDNLRRWCIHGSMSVRGPRQKATRGTVKHPKGQQRLHQWHQIMGFADRRIACDCRWSHFGPPGHPPGSPKSRHRKGRVG